MCYSQQETNFHRFIEDVFGLPVVQLIRALEQEVKRLARFKNHRIFNLRCKDLNILPRDLYRLCPVNSSRAKRLTRNYGFSLLQERIGECCKIISKAEEKMNQLKGILGDILNHDIYLDVIRLTEASGERIFTIFRDRQLKKLNNLTHEICKSKHYPFVRNLSSVPLSDSELSVLNRGPKFALSSKTIPVTEFISGIEEGLKHVPHSVGNIARAKISNLLNVSRPIQLNLPREEFVAVKNLKENKNVIILPADKGGGLVCLDKQDYVKKVEAILNDGDTYEKSDWNPRNWIFDRTVDIVKDIKRAGGIDYKTSLNMYPSTSVLPSFYGLPKVHKPDVPLRPIVSYSGTTTLGLASYIASILSPLIGQSTYHVRDSRDFKTFINQVVLEEGEVLVSFDVTALFTSVPVEDAIEVVRVRLEEDITLGERCNISVDNICRILRFLLNNTYFTFMGVCYKQSFGAAMGSPVSVMIANIFMEDLEKRAIQTFEYPIRFWKRYVDDICAALKNQFVTPLLTHLNSLAPSIVFTHELETEGKLPFLDILLLRKDNGRVKTEVYRKPTALGQYLNFESNHPMSMKRGIVKTLLHRAESLSSCKDSYHREAQKIKSDLVDNGYPPTFIQEVERDLNHQRERIVENEWKGFAVIPYVKGVSDSIRRILGRLGIRVTFRPARTIRSMVCKPKDAISKLDKCGVVYKIPCRDCREVYIGETKRELGKRLQEHQGALTGNHPATSAVAEHSLSNAHEIAWEEITIVDSQQNYYGRRIKEAIHARLNAPIMNRDDLFSINSAWLPVLHRL